MGNADRTAVEEANTAFYAAFESGDLDAMARLWVDDPEALCVHPGARPVQGASAILRSWALVMAHTPYIQFFLTDVEISVRGDTASVSCAENVLTDAGAGPGTAGGEAAFQGTSAVATNVFVRTTEGWRLWIHHASPVVSAGHQEDGSDD